MFGLRDNGFAALFLN